MNNGQNCTTQGYSIERCNVLLLGAAAAEGTVDAKKGETGRGR